MDFGDALKALRSRSRVTRAGWNGKDMLEINYLPHIDMRTVDGSCVPWLASQTDVLADDWQEV